MNDAPPASGAAPRDTFCILAWTNLMVLPEGVAKVCCAAAEVIRDADGPMHIGDHSAEAIWNSAHMREMRRAMAAAEPVDDCASCYLAETANGASMRTLQNQLHFGADAAAAIATHRAASAARGHRADALPVALHLTVSNLCNLTCRMCNSSYSSQIEHHEVLSRWAPPFTGLFGPRRPARLVTRRIGPRPALGVRAVGIGAVGADGIAMTAPHAALDLPVAWFEKPMLLRLAVAPMAPSRALRVQVGDRTLFDGTVGAAAQLDLDISWLPDTAQLAVALDSAGGIALGALDLTLVLAGDETRAAGKPGERPSANHNPAIETLLANPALGHVNFTGGEPMLMPEVAEAIDYLIADGRAPHMSISLATNGTRIDWALIDKMKRFRHATLFVSIDGVGPLFEYIRVPARWDRVAANLEKLAERFDPTRIYLHPTVQAYNVLDIVEICRCADALGVNIELLDILVWPRRLMIQTMPRAVRQRALARLRDYRARECRPVNHRPVDDLIGNLERTMDEHHPELMPEFRRFTAELDAVHGQNFRAACPELFDLIEAAAG
jgi:MoaA/NifB/PqqE/SkfB family radical SAM enzyme